MSDLENLKAELTASTSKAAQPLAEEEGIFYISKALVRSGRNEGQIEVGYIEISPNRDLDAFPRWTFPMDSVPRQIVEKLNVTCSSFNKNVAIPVYGQTLPGGQIRPDKLNTLRLADSAQATQIFAFGDHVGMGPTNIPTSSSKVSFEDLTEDPAYLLLLSEAEQSAGVCGVAEDPGQMLDIPDESSIAPSQAQSTSSLHLAPTQSRVEQDANAASMEANLGQTHITESSPPSLEAENEQQPVLPRQPSPKSPMDIPLPSSPSTSSIAAQSGQSHSSLRIAPTQPPAKPSSSAMQSGQGSTSSLSVAHTQPPAEQGSSVPQSAQSSNSSLPGAHTQPPAEQGSSVAQSGQGSTSSLSVAHTQPPAEQGSSVPQSAQSSTSSLSVAAQAVTMQPSSTAQMQSSSSVQSASHVSPRSSSAPLIEPVSADEEDNSYCCSLCFKTWFSPRSR
jgi:hypothetical protein